jgi:cytidylate kinase
MIKIITVTGDLGSGKSTVSNILLKHLNYDYIYTGRIQRDMANRHNMTTMELNTYAETHPEIDEEIDSTFKSLNSSSDLIVDSRLAWFFIPDSFKVFLKTNIIVSANRISGDSLRKSEKYTSREDAVKSITARKASENKRYMELYSADCSDLSNFNLVVDTSFIAPEKVAEIILAEYTAWLLSGNCSKALVSPENLYPTKLPDCAANTDCRQHDAPVTLVCINSFDYILEGHAQISLAIRNSADLIPAVYKRENDCLASGATCREYVNNSLTANMLREWETANSFTFLAYPSGI